MDWLAMSIIYPKIFNESEQKTIAIEFDLSTAESLIERLKLHSKACDDDYISTFLEDLKEKVKKSYEND